jgi:hypothetical protein
VVEKVTLPHIVIIVVVIAAVLVVIVIVGLTQGQLR